MVGSILPISLQQIKYEKIYAHSNELAKIYTMKPITIFIDKYKQLKYDL